MSPLRLIPLLLGLSAMFAAPIASHAAGTPAAADPTLRVMSFNIRLSSANDGADGWIHRRALFLDTVAYFQPSLMGFQEVLADQHDELTQRFRDYGFVGVAREDGKRRGEWALIGYRRDRFTALADGNFWLSEHPEVPGSKSWNTAYTRICTWVRLKDNVTGRELLYANTHLDNESAWARAEAGRLIGTRLPHLAQGAPVILTADFNMNEDDPSFAPLVHPTDPAAVRMVDSYREVHPARAPDEATFHAFSGKAQGSRIDFIFHSPGLIATAADIVRTHSADGHYPSDHFAVTAVLMER